LTATGNYLSKSKHPNKVEQWAEEKQQLTIGGHTHRALCPVGELESYYFNSGSCVHPRCITAIEIEQRSLRLVKWYVDVDRDNHLLVKKELLMQHYLV